MPLPVVDDAAIRAAFGRWFGHADFRAGQLEAVRESLAGRDVVLVMPTGSGKSLCYQLAALLLPHTTLVISPLIALMKDQVDALEGRGIAATFLNATLPPHEMNARLAAMRSGRFKLVYIAPERFRNSRFLEALAATPISLFTVDEAHCISQWGHDFRPDYLNLRHALGRLDGPRVLAVTATATPDVREDIVAQLALGEAPRGAPAVHVHGFSRPNLRLVVTRTPTHAAKLARVKACIADHGSGIVYVATRRQAERVQTLLVEKCGIQALLYHGALADDERARVQDAFTAAASPVIVATNAFGMGVDYEALRFVVHWDVPGSVEAYYQEVGRAGRDGKPARCELLFNYADVRTQRFFIDGANPSTDAVLHVWETVKQLCADGPQVLSGDAWATAAGEKNAMSVRTALALLERAGLVRREQAPGTRTATTTVVPGADPAALQSQFDALRAKTDRDNQRLEAMLRFVDHPGCRHAYILAYFGETSAAVCGGCDRCTPRTSSPAKSLTEEQWLVVQKILSCVGRMNGRYGARRISQVLRGDSDPYLTERGLDGLSTYGLLCDLPPATLAALLDALIAAGCIGVTPDTYRQLSLTPYGGKVVHRSVLDFTLSWPHVPVVPRTRRARSSAVEADPATAKLHAWRAAEAVRRQIPTYQVLHNRTIKELVQRQPHDVEDLEDVYGLGPITINRYGLALLDLLASR